MESVNERVFVGDDVVSVSEPVIEEPRTASQEFAKAIVTGDFEGVVALVAKHGTGITIPFRDAAWCPEEILSVADFARKNVYPRRANGGFEPYDDRIKAIEGFLTVITIVGHHRLK